MRVYIIDLRVLSARTFPVFFLLLGSLSVGLRSIGGVCLLTVRGSSDFFALFSTKTHAVSCFPFLFDGSLRVRIYNKTML